MNAKTKRWVSPTEQLERQLRRDLKGNALLRALDHVKTLSVSEVFSLNERIKGLPKKSSTYRDILNDLALHRS